MNTFSDHTQYLYSSITITMYNYTRTEHFYVFNGKNLKYTQYDILAQFD